uniref:Putative secreted protein n=1 Tax=Ixodes ricinus TaxID=34613 RepID=A0A6B0UI91_IXORI
MHLLLETAASCVVFAVVVPSVDTSALRIALEKPLRGTKRKGHANSHKLRAAADVTVIRSRREPLHCCPQYFPGVDGRRHTTGTHHRKSGPTRKGPSSVT